MSIQQAAQAAVATFPNVNVSTDAGTLRLPVVMVARAGVESSWNPSATGDWNGERYTLSNGQTGTIADSPYACYMNGTYGWHYYQSLGLWQINMPSHAAYLRSVTGSASPCVWAKWLLNPTNNAKAARYLLGNPISFSPWASEYDSWHRYIGQAQTAVNAVLASGSTLATTTTKKTGTSSTVSTFIGKAAPYALWGLLGLAGVAGGAVLLDEAGAFQRWRR